jgi:hypothetical protein
MFGRYLILTITMGYIISYMMFSQLATRNVQQGIREVRKCQKAENCVIKLGISCPIVCCSDSKICHITGEAYCHISKTLPTIGYEIYAHHLHSEEYYFYLLYTTVATDVLSFTSCRSLQQRAGIMNECCEHNKLNAALQKCFRYFQSKMDT